MEFFIDTANIEEIRDAAALGFISGVTTNPSLIAKENGDFQAIIKEISRIVPGPISAEVIATDWEGMVKEGRELAKLGDNIVIKVPMTTDGLKAVKILTAENIDTNVTLVFSANQALLAARAGAAYVSPFVGRLDDISYDGIELIELISHIFALHDLRAKIIAASIRHPVHITKCAEAGAHIATVPYKVLLQALKHPLTDAGIAKFLADWEKNKK